MNDVGRLDVAVDDALAVRGIERVGERHPDLDNLDDLHAAPMQAAMERLALEQFHGNERRRGRVAGPMS